MKKKLYLLHETLSPDYLETNDIIDIHEEVYSSLVTYFTKEENSKTAQPHLLVGEVGCGKTFLIKLLYKTIKRDFNNTLFPILIEGKSLFSVEGIWSQCISRLKIQCTYDNYTGLLEWQERNAKRIVLFIDNIQYFFNRTDNSEHYILRGNINKAGAPILIASSETVIPAFTEYDAAFFDGFKISYMKSLDIPVISNLINGQYDILRLEKIMAYLPKTIRSLFTAIEILEKSNHPENDLALTVDYFHYIYQEKFDVATTQVQKILLALAQADTGLTLSELRDLTGQENEKISPYLTLMISKETIHKESQTLRGGTYYIADPLFKLWLQNNIIKLYQ
ncbi:MAG: AAA family ATPase [Candidatus Cryptobacteroides sp.]